ncbi:MAG TPA: hypothetical protein VE969_02990 [Pyrinomonadaceae bacterium]|nr:hypothetical protein [Pyrinomonadaceae bacterium]
MKRKLIASSIIVASLIVSVSSLLFAQRQRTSAPAASDVGNYVPASDAIAVVNVKRMLNETMPMILGSDPAKLAQANAEVDKFKTKTGIDPRSFDRVVFGLRYTYPTPNTTKVESVAIAHGTINANGLASAVRLAANGKSREEKYRGANIIIVSINDQMKVLGLFDVHVSDLAICALDENSLALGTLGNVKAAIDAGKRGRAPADLIALATRDGNAVAGFGANLSGQLLGKLDVGNDTLAKDVSSIKQAYGSVGSTQSDVTMMLVARTDSADAAKNLGDTVEGLRQLGSMFLGRMAQPRKALAESALNNLKVTARGNELEVRTQVAAANLAALMK